MEITTIKDRYIPIAVYKCFTKMAISIISDEELEKIDWTIEWVSEKKHKKVDIVYNRFYYILLLHLGHRHIQELIYFYLGERNYLITKYLYRMLFLTLYLLLDSRVLYTRYTLKIILLCTVEKLIELLNI